jgi:hypothetical protein
MKHTSESFSHSSDRREQTRKTRYRPNVPVDGAADTFHMPLYPWMKEKQEKTVHKWRGFWHGSREKRCRARLIYKHTGIRERLPVPFKLVAFIVCKAVHFLSFMRVHHTLAYTGQHRDTSAATNQSRQTWIPRTPNASRSSYPSTCVLVSKFILQSHVICNMR